MSAQVIVPYLFRREKLKSAHENRFSWKMRNTRKAIFRITRPEAQNRGHSRRFFHYRRCNDPGNTGFPF
jgi:hypothetical protein